MMAVIPIVILCVVLAALLVLYVIWARKMYRSYEYSVVEELIRRDASEFNAAAEDASSPIARVEADDAAFCQHGNSEPSSEEVPVSDEGEEDLEELADESSA